MSSNNLSIQNSIGARLFSIVFAIYFVITITLTVIHMVAEFNNTQDRLLKDLKGFYTSYAPGLTHAMWGVDEKQVQSTLEGMLKLSSVTGVKVVDDRGSFLYGMGSYIDDNQTTDIKDNNQKDLFSTTAPIIYQGPDIPKSQKLGTITIYSDSGVVFQQVKYGFIFIIVNAILKTIAIWVIFLWVSRKYLSRPLNELTTAISSIGLDNLDNAKVDLKISGNNELTILEKGFNSMTDKLNQSYRSQKELHKSLESSQKFLADAQQISHLGNWSLNVK